MDNFSLHDLEDDEQHSSLEAGQDAPAAAAPPPATSAPSLPESDLKAEAPKTKLLKDLPKSDAVE